MSDVAANVCDINVMVGKLNRVVRQTHGCDIKELEQTANAIETFAKQIKEWCATKQ